MQNSDQPSSSFDSRVMPVVKLVLVFLMLCLVRAVTESYYIYLLACVIILSLRVESILTMFKLLFVLRTLIAWGFEGDLKATHPEVPGLPKLSLSTSVGLIVGAAIGFFILIAIPYTAFHFGKAIVLALSGAP